MSHPTEVVLLADGELLTGTPRERHLPATAVLATLLQALLDRAPLGHRAAPALDAVIAQGLGVSQSVRLASARALAEALQAFEGPDPKNDLRALFARWRAVCDIGSDLPDATQTAQVVLDATGDVRRSVLVPKPDRRRYERVALSAIEAPEAVVRAAAAVPAWGDARIALRAVELRRALARAQEVLAHTQTQRNVRDVALAATLLVAAVPAGWWLAGAFDGRSTPPTVTSENTGINTAAIGIRELEPDTSLEPSFAVRPELIGTVDEASPPGVTTGSEMNFSLAKVVTDAPLIATSGPAPRTLRRTVKPIPSAFWFPDGKRIGYNRGRVLEIVEVKSGRSRAFSTPRRSRIGTLAVSPDGRRVVFNAGREGAWLVDLSKRDRSQLQRLVADTSVRSFVWSPDGKRLAYYSRRKGDWLVIQR